MSLGVHISSGVSHTCFVRRFTASCEINLGEAKGMRCEFGVAINNVGCWLSATCVRGERRCAGGGHSIGGVVPGMLLLVSRWSVRGAS